MCMTVSLSPARAVLDPKFPCLSLSSAGRSGIVDGHCLLVDNSTHSIEVTNCHLRNGVPIFIPCTRHGKPRGRNVPQGHPEQNTKKSLVWRFTPQHLGGRGGS